MVAASTTMAMILVADDVASVRRVLFLTLNRENTVLEATTGTEALALTEQHRPDIVILDVAVPGLDGLTACRRLRSDPALRHVGIVIHSGSSNAEAARDAGADAFVGKPSL